MHINDATDDVPIRTHLSRDQIIEATSVCLDQHGYDATTIRQIAGVLNCAVGSIYRYFGDKRELLSVVSQRMLESVASAVEAGRGIEQTAVAYHQCATADDSRYRLMFWLAAVTPPDRPWVGSAAPDRRGGVLPKVVLRIIDGWARQLGDVAVARRCWSLLHGGIVIHEPIDCVLAAMRQIVGESGEAAPPAPVAPRPLVEISAVRRQTVGTSGGHNRSLPDAYVG